jgi:hypothetical protein
MPAARALEHRVHRRVLRLARVQYESHGLARIECRGELGGACGLTPRRRGHGFRQHK